VVENATETEGHDAMAYAAIDVRHRMACRWISCLVSCGNSMAGITPVTNNGRVGVVGVGRQKTDSGMTETAFNVCSYMAYVLTFRHSAVVATGAYSSNIRMIKAAIRS